MQVKLKVDRQTIAGLDKAGTVVEIADGEAERLIGLNLAEKPDTKETKNGKAVKHGKG